MRCSEALFETQIDYRFAGMNTSFHPITVLYECHVGNPSRETRQMGVINNVRYAPAIFVNISGRQLDPGIVKLI
jgi:hypothetical protein